MAHVALHNASPVTRRQLLAGAGRIAGLAIAPPLLAAAPALAAAPSVVHLSSFGARGDGYSDDSAAIQAALNAAAPGATVNGSPGAVYVVNSPVSFAKDGVTLDLRGGAVRIGRQRTGQAQSNDLIFTMNGRTGVRITNGSILAPLSPFYGGGMPYRLQIVGGQRCQIDHIVAECGGSAFVLISGSGHTIAGNTINHGSIMGTGTTNVVVQANTISNSPAKADAIAFVGYPGAAVVGTQYLDNVITGYGRVAIEEYSASGPQYTLNAVIRGNHISAPAPTGAQGISAMVTGAVIEQNTIVDARGWAIEADGLGTTVRGNDISWSSVGQDALNGTGIVINGSIPHNTSPVLVQGNSVQGAGTAIAMLGGPFYGPVTIDSNQVTNPLSYGIVLQSGTRDGLVRATSNTVTINRPPQRGTNRFAFKTASGTVLQWNKALYTTQSYSPGVYDIAYFLVGNDVTMIGNISDGGGRSDPYIGSATIGGPYSGWTLIGNSFIHGAPILLNGLVSPVLSGNAGTIH